MTPTQILLNNLLYDVGEMTIPTDEVDEEQLRRPAHWDLGLIQRFMMVFGPISSLFDFLTFGVMLWVFHAGQSLFQTGWFVESIATQTLIIFVIRTHRTPFFLSRPSVALAGTSIAASWWARPSPSRRWVASLDSPRCRRSSSWCWPGWWRPTWSWSRPPRRSSIGPSPPAGRWPWSRADATSW
jgi:hypothetical protein